MDQTKDAVAYLAMRNKLTLRLDVCVQNGCADTDMFMVSLNIRRRKNKPARSRKRI